MSVEFPELTNSFLHGQDILYKQFNDIEFYVEDIDKEHFYFNILKRLFSDIKLHKIFPLNGKKDVINTAKNNVNNRKKVYIVDLDFDKILGRVEQLSNLFYIERYSIENYLFSKLSIYECIRSKNPKMKDTDIDIKIDYEKLIDNAIESLRELASVFIIIKQYELSCEYYKLDVKRDFDFSFSSVHYKNSFIPKYLLEIENKLKSKNSRVTLNGQIKKMKKHFNTRIKATTNIPGKYILMFIKDRLQFLKLINQVSFDSFTYNLSKDFDGAELNYLRKEILNYIEK